MSGFRIKLIFSIWLALVALTVWGSLTPGSEMPQPGISDKVIHFTAYWILAIIPAWQFEPARFGFWSGLSMMILGVVLEFGQGYVPQRSFEVEDMIANTAGVILGLGLGTWLRHLKTTRP